MSSGVASAGAIDLISSVAPRALHIEGDFEINLVERLTLSTFKNATQAAALAAAHARGRGQSNWADQLAVEAMRECLNKELLIPAEVVIGEGERDEAPMLFIGERLGRGVAPQAQIAVDPLEGTNLCARGEPGAISVIAGAMIGEGSLLGGIDGYMDKLVIGRELRQKLDHPKTREIFPQLSQEKGLLDYAIEPVAYWISDMLGKPIYDVVVKVLERDRNAKLVERLRALNVQIYLIRDGDITAGLEALHPKHSVDLAIGIGAAPEGVITAAATRVFHGYMEARWWFSGDEKGAAHRQRLLAKSIDPDRLYHVQDLARGEVFFAFTGVTDTAFTKGIRYLRSGGAISQGVFGRTRSGTINCPTTYHGKPPEPPEWPEN